MWTFVMFHLVMVHTGCPHLSLRAQWELQSSRWSLCQRLLLKDTRSLCSNLTNYNANWVLANDLILCWHTGLCRCDLSYLFVQLKPFESRFDTLKLTYFCLQGCFCFWQLSGEKNCDNQALEQGDWTQQDERKHPCVCRSSLTPWTRSSCGYINMSPWSIALISAVDSSAGFLSVVCKPFL